MYVVGGDMAFTKDCPFNRNELEGFFVVVVAFRTCCLALQQTTARTQKDTDVIHTHTDSNRCGCCETHNVCSFTLWRK